MSDTDKGSTNLRQNPDMGAVPMAEHIKSTAIFVRPTGTEHDAIRQQYNDERIRRGYPPLSYDDIEVIEA